MTPIRIVPTADGSHTLYSDRHKAHYHSLNGALQESLHIYIRNGYEYLSLNEISILEVGFGTGLNAALTALSAIEMSRKTIYTGIELYPLQDEILTELNYGTILNDEVIEFWKKITAVSLNGM